MSAETLRGHLVTAIDETLDKMAFMSFTADARVAAADSPFAYAVRIGFSGSLSGNLDVFFTEKTAGAIARNLLGLRDADPLFPGTAEDALKEFANILMGRAMTLLDRTSPFKLQIPEAWSDLTQAPKAERTDLEIRGMFDDFEPCRLVLAWQ